VGVTPYYYDDDSDEEFWFWIRDCFTDGSTANETELHSFTSSGQPGYAAGYQAFSSSVTVYNYENGAGGGHFYNVLIRLGGGSAGSAVRFGGMNVWFLRQVSPKPASATFGDVPTGHWAFQFIEALADSSITIGCGGGNYCPDQAVTRAEMATFLARAFGLNWPDA
jgi:hypothetical protein